MKNTKELINVLNKHLDNVKKLNEYKSLIDLQEEIIPYYLDSSYSQEEIELINNLKNSLDALYEFQRKNSDIYFKENKRNLL